MDLYVAELLFGGFILLLLVGAPITVALGGAGMMAYIALDKDPIALVQIAFNSVGSFPLMALPAFVLAGALMEAAGISKRLVDIAESLAGPITGGLGAATVIACLFFGAISGSGPATTAAVGMLMIPAMTKRNYDRAYASAVTSASGGLGIIIPPSIPMVIFGIAALGMQPPPEAVEKFGQFASLSIPKLFIAGVVPGILMAGSLLVMNYFISKKNGYKGMTENWSFGDVTASLKRGVWAALAPVIILGGIYTGMFTPTESAIVAIFYTLFVGAFIHRELEFKKVQEALRTTTWITGRVLLILFTATAFGRLLVEQRIPADIAESMLAMTDNVYIIWALVIVFLLFVGMFMETLAAILILVPVLLPVMYTMGADPTHVGIIVICTLSIGFMTPPLGENLFVASGIGGETVERITVRVMPFVAITIVTVFTIAFFPQIALWLPSKMGY